MVGPNSVLFRYVVTIYQVMVDSTIESSNQLFKDLLHWNALLRDRGFHNVSVSA